MLESGGDGLVVCGLRRVGVVFGGGEEGGGMGGGKRGGGDIGVKET